MCCPASWNKVSTNVSISGRRGSLLHGSSDCNANIVALAAFVARSRIVSFEALTAAVKDKFAEKAKLIPLNLKALEAGRKAATGQ